MKKLLLPILTCAALTASSYAGEDYSPKGGKEIIPPPPSCLWTWFAGGSVGEITGDWDEEIYTLHVGVERKCPDQNCTHAFFLEVGWSDYDETIGIIDPGATGAVVFLDHDVTIDIVPITFNYKYECTLSGSLSWYAGAGAGVALVDIDVDGPVTNNSDDDTAFYAHIFAGIVYNVNETFEVTAGARYIFMDDVFGADSPLDGEIHYELGGRINF